MIMNLSTAKIYLNLFKMTIMLNLGNKYNIFKNLSFFLSLILIFLYFSLNIDEFLMPVMLAQDNFYI